MEHDIFKDKSNDIRIIPTIYLTMMIGRASFFFFLKKKKEKERKDLQKDPTSKRELICGESSYKVSKR